MHASSLENMHRCYERFICGDYLSRHDKISVLDVGGANVNGSYADIFSLEKFNYIAADIAASEGVDVVLSDPYKLPFADHSVDIIISGQAFEHVEYFWLLFEEMSRVLAQDGWLFLIAPSAGPIHQYPVDCYRFYPDAFYALARYAKLVTVDVRLDERGPWRDLVGVFAHNNKEITPTSNQWRPLKPSEKNKYSAQRAPSNTQFNDEYTEINQINGELNYLEVLAILHDRLTISNYLEIGVRNGHSLRLAKSKAIAIDPDPNIDVNDFNQLDLYQMPSDYFFSNQTDIDFEKAPIDFAFIDGMHLFEFVLRDFINIESRSANEATIVIDDIFPNHPVQASPQRASNVWTGDVWKIVVCLKRYRPDLSLTMIDSSPTGLLLITGLNKNNRVLTDHYNPIVREFNSLDLMDYESLILKRDESISPLDWQQQ
ncbi:MAG: ubiquinone/menaquinone biosynthesis C-methylase UbiE [Arenicella sp.]|jgi:ubiquinone/menaquinone biosynthesis C-methylase UbiE